MINWIDIVIILLIFSSGAAGWRRGLVRQLFDIASVLASYFIALRYGGSLVVWIEKYVPLAQWLPTFFATPLTEGFVLGDIILRLLGFSAIYFAARLFFGLLSSLLHGIFSLPLLGTVNCFSGMILGAAKGLLLTLIMIAVLSFVSIPLLQQVMEESVAATYFNYWWPVVYQQMTDYLLIDLLNAV